MNEKQITSHNNQDTITVCHQQQHKERNLLTLSSNAKMITVPTAAIDAEQDVPTDTMDTGLKDNHHLDKTRKPKNKMNQATMVYAPSDKQKEYTTYKEWINKHDNKDDWTTVHSPKR